jgi:hypothetical protein
VDALRVQAMVASRQGHDDEATRALEEALPLARSMPHPYAEGRLLYIYAELYVHQGLVGPARDRLEAALAIFRRLGARRDARRAEQALQHPPDEPDPL